jgi:hypothetical protein
MALHRTHEFFGLLVGVLFTVFLVVAYPQLTRQELILRGLLGFSFCFLGAVLPDIDERRSRVFRRSRTAVGVAVFAIALYFLSRSGITALGVAISTLVAGFAIVMMYQLKPRHRGVIHTLRAAATYSLAVFVITYALLPDAALSLTVALFGFGGYGSHLVLDRSVKL